MLDYLQAPPPQSPQTAPNCDVLVIAGGRAVIAAKHDDDRTQSWHARLSEATCCVVALANLKRSIAAWRRHRSHMRHVSAPETVASQ